VVDDPAALPRAIEVLLRAGCWNIGLGAGEVDEPLPAQARAGRGPAYLRARAAVTAAKTSPWHLRVVGDADQGRHLESVLWLVAALVGRRSPKGWEVVDLADEGLSYEEIGRRLGISQSAVSQRAQAAGLVEGRRAREVVTHLAADLLGRKP
jgi:DNA-binding NarL/FixJ family response regulator